MKPANCSQNHCVNVKDGIAYAWAISRRCGNRFGQLGRNNTTMTTKIENEASSVGINLKQSKSNVIITQAACGGSKDSGHTLLLDQAGHVYACGCDRWQQLGFGSTKAGAVGYTWKQGKISQSVPQEIQALHPQILKNNDHVVGVAAGDDHSVALLQSGEVWTWGRGEHGQLGQGGKPFVMPPTKSKELTEGGKARAIVAASNCTGVVIEKHNGHLTLQHVGRCPKQLLEKWASLYV